MQESEVNYPKVFQKQQFEYKNCISPSIIDNFVINESHFGEELTDDGISKKQSKEDKGFEDDDFNPFKNVKSGDSIASGSQNEDQLQGHSFKGLREFRLSIDGTNDPSTHGRPNSSAYSKVSKHRKFTLSFDGSSKPANDPQEDFFIKFDEETSPQAHLSKLNKKGEEIEDDEEASFEFHIEDNHFTDDLAGFDDAIRDDPTDEKGLKGLMKPSSTDRNTRDSTQGSMTNLKCGWLNRMSSNDDFSLCIYHLEDIRRRLEKKNSKISTLYKLDSPAEEGQSMYPSKSVRTSDLKETMINNFVEIIDFRNKIKESNFDLIL